MSDCEDGFKPGEQVDSEAAAAKPRDAFRPASVVETLDPALKANPVFSQLSSTVERAGYLIKQGGNWKSWKKRYFFLSGPFITYYHDEDDPTPKGVIILVKCRVEICPTSKWGREHCFEIKHSDRRTFILQGQSEAHREEWVSAIREGIEWPKLIPELLKEFDLVSKRLETKETELKAAYDQVDSVRKTLHRLQADVDDKKAMAALFSVKMEEKEAEIRSRDEVIEKLKRIAKSGGDSSEAVEKLESENAQLRSVQQQLLDKAKKYRDERDILKEEVIRLKKLTKEAGLE